MKRLVQKYAVLSMFCILFCSMFFGGAKEVHAKEAQDAYLNYTVIESSELQTPQSQTVVVSIGKEGKNKLESAVLIFQNRTTKVRYDVTGEIYQDVAVFVMEFDSEDWKGTYELTQISGVYDGKDYTILYETTGNPVRFAVNKTITTSPDAIVDGMIHEEDKQIVTVDVNGTKADIKDAVSAATTDNSLGMETTVSRKGASKSDKLVVVLDPGHGGGDSGAVRGGLVEKNINLKIAGYCKDELEDYSGVKVYMTRTGDNYLTLEQRVNYAASVGADIFVSLHINAAASSSAAGAEVYYPNGNYNGSISSEGRNLASNILRKLVSLGLADRGVKIRNSGTNDKYPDGSLADYYGVIRRSKLAGFPGIIVEHGFVSNGGDAGRFLSNDSQLKQLGIADATGIAETYGLYKKDKLGDTKITQLVGRNSKFVSLKWKEIISAKGYQIYRSTSKDGKYKKIATINKGSKTYYEDYDVEAGKTYYYKVRGFKTYNKKEIKSSFSEIEKVKVLKKITSLKAINNAKWVKIKWKRVSGAKGYRIYRSTSPNGTYKRIADVKKSKLSYKDTKAKKGKTYYYKVRATAAGIDGTTVSSYSPKVEGMVKAE